MFWAECKQLWEEGVKGYFSQMWNYMDITMLALYTAGYSTEGVIYTKTRGLVAADNLIHGDGKYWSNHFTLFYFFLCWIYVNYFGLLGGLNMP